MKTDPALWQRLSELQFDDPEVDFPFSQRLARDNNWPHAYARRVIDEYRRFVYLAAISDEQVTPSDEVDQAWHLHLAYTRYYWGAFRDALGCDLHHEPTRGGREQFETFHDNYKHTLELYRQEFGRPPPRSIWPFPEKRFRSDIDRRRVNVKGRLLMPSRWFFAAIAVLVCLPLIFAFLSPEVRLGPGETASCESTVTCASIALGMLNAEYSGTMFMVFVGTIIAFALSSGIDRITSGSRGSDNGLTFAIAYGGGGGGCAGGGNLAGDGCGGGGGCGD